MVFGKCGVLCSVHLPPKQQNNRNLRMLLGLLFPPPHGYRLLHPVANIKVNSSRNKMLL